MHAKFTLQINTIGSEGRQVDEVGNDGWIWGAWSMDFRDFDRSLYGWGHDVIVRGS